MRKAPAFQLYASDLLVDTLEWDIDEIGIYTRLLSAEWANGDLPEDINRLARIAGCSPKRMQKAWGIVSVKFIQNGKGRLINLRLEETRQKQLEYAESQRERAERRWGKKGAGADASASAEGVPKPCSSSSSSNKDIKNNNKTYRGKFIIPSLEEVSGYCLERQNTLNPQTFINHYSSNGWMVGKNKMRDWKAAIRTWETRGGNGNGSGSIRGSGASIEKAGRAKSDGLPYPVDAEF